MNISESDYQENSDDDVVWDHLTSRDLKNSERRFAVTNP